MKTDHTVLPIDQIEDALTLVRGVEVLLLELPEGVEKTAVQVMMARAVGKIDRAHMTMQQAIEAGWPA